MSSTNCLLPNVFNALPAKRKAVLIARDVIAQIAINAFNVKTGSYISGELATTPSDGILSTASEAGRNIIQKSNCTVCAKGAIFLSAVQRSNKMNLAKVTDVIEVNETGWCGREQEQALSRKVCKQDRIFGESNFNLIESAFEIEPEFYDSDGNYEGYYYGVYEGDVPDTLDSDSAKVKNCKAALRFGLRYEDSNVRLSAICLNIIANNGVFDPTKNIPSVREAKKAITIPQKKKKA